ncbi:MAG: T9SS type A sorting domain-containing protein [Gemmatimonadetes bacterium]|nr:T9SS type A sorting domain-containing protein [Gemmatimonadota bacterium]
MIPSTPTAIELSSPLPTQTTLLANFPNPFNPDTYIPYQLHAPAHVSLSIYDIRGALIREIDLGYRAAGQYLTSANAAHWDGRDHRGQRVASGVYLYRLQAGPVAHVRKMVLVK